MPYETPQDMMAAFSESMTVKKAKKKYNINDARRIIQDPLTYNIINTSSPFAIERTALKETDQTPRQWNLITIKRCIVTREEFYRCGGLQAVLAQKGFPVCSPENGDLMISWFDAKEGVAYYELCRVQDQGELLKYMQEKFIQRGEEDGERAISFE